jgi:hypothetical protein
MADQHDALSDLSEAELREQVLTAERLLEDARRIESAVDEIDQERTISPIDLPMSTDINSHLHQVTSEMRPVISALEDDVRALNDELTDRDMDTIETVR